MATVARSNRAFVKRQRRLFRWAGAIDFASYELTPRWGRLGDLAIRSHLRRYPGAAQVSIPITEESYRIRGYDDEAAVEDLYFTYVKKGGRWLIASDRDLEGAGLFSARHPWDFGPLVKRRSRHFLMLSHPCGSTAGCPTIPPSFLSVAESALDRADSYWAPQWQKSVLVFAPSSSDELSRLIQATFEMDNFVAFAYSTIDTHRNLDYTGHRILLNWPEMDGRSESSIRAILSHELLHVATREVTGPFTPVFVDEGIAEFAGYDADPEALSFFDSEVDAGAFDRLLPEDFEFVTGSGTDIFTSYQEAQSAVRFFVKRYGLRKFTNFYVRLGRDHVAPGTSRYRVDHALRETLGLGLREFEGAWASSIGG
jgi:hypothetical protein